MHRCSAASTGKFELAYYKYEIISKIINGYINKLMSCLKNAQFINIEINRILMLNINK